MEPSLPGRPRGFFGWMVHALSRWMVGQGTSRWIGRVVCRSIPTGSNTTIRNHSYSLLRVNSSELAIATDAGLFMYNTQFQQLSPLIANVEFNRRGLYLEDDRLYAGSINGLYILDGKRLEALAEMASRRVASTVLSKFVMPLFVVISLIALSLAVLLYRSRRKLKQMDIERMVADIPEVTREEVERFIQENLALASLKSISEQFGTNNANIYTLLSPEKPGAFINRLRMEQVQQMRKDRKSAREIAEQTGFSESYVRKVWNQ
jgi:AraC-like DNA-binding protein